MTRSASEPSAAAPLIDLQSLVVAVRRRRRLWLAMALLGLLAGTTMAVLLPPPPTAVTTVLVAHREDQPNDTGTLIRTDVALLTTTRIAGSALEALGSRDRPEDFLEDYRGAGLSNNLLRIDVTGASDSQAVARAGALADAFVADHVRRMRETAEAEAKALLDQRDRMRTELAQVNEAIGKRSPESDPQASASIESLFARRAELNSRIADFDQRAAEAGTGAPRLVAGTQIVDAPRAVHHSLPRTAATNGGIGLALGLVVGLALAAVGSVVADRPVLRRDIAAHLGASVIAELPHRSGRLWRRRRTRTAHERLTASLARTVRGREDPLPLPGLSLPEATLPGASLPGLSLPEATLPVAPLPGLSLLELGCARGASTIALNLAGALSADGPVAVVDGLPGSQLAGRPPRPGGPVVIGGERAAAGSQGEIRIGVGSVAPGTAWTDLRYLGSRTVLVVRAGHGSAAWLHTVARQLADQHVPVLGVVLVDPDPRDRTDGTLWDGPPTASPATARSERAARQNGAGRPLPARTARALDIDQEAR